jgi:hypothetical protein
MWKAVGGILAGMGVGMALINTAMYEKALAKIGIVDMEGFDGSEVVDFLVCGTTTVAGYLLVKKIFKS